MAARHPNTATTQADAPRPRPLETQDWLNRRIYHPPARRLARALLPTRITPNMVSVAGGLAIVAAAAAYTLMAGPAGVVLGFLLHASWHVLDGADGELARLSGRSSPTGELVDGVCDYIGHIVLYFALGGLLAGQIGGSAWVIGSLAAASHIAQTNHAETQRRSYLWWAYGISWLKHAQAAEDEVFRHRNWFSFSFAWLARVYLKLAKALNPYTAEVDLLVAEAQADPTRRERIGRLAREHAGASLSLQNLVGANPRAIILGLAMAAGSPLYFFLAECLLLNLLLIVSVRYHRAASRRLAEAIRRDDAGRSG
jgi:phosphatidylglycerophosphate synthase